MSLVLKAQERKYSIFLIFALCLLFLGQASAWTSSEFVLDSEKILEKIDTTTKYGTYKIEESSWYDPLQIWTKEKVAEVELNKNDDNCVACSSIQTIRLEKEMPLIDEVNYYEKALGIFNVKSNKISNQKFYVHTSYKYDLVEKEYEETTCDESGEICSTSIATKEVLIKEVPKYITVCESETLYEDVEINSTRENINGTIEEYLEIIKQPYESQTCSRVQDGTEIVEAEEWEEYELGRVMSAGEYTVKQTAIKKPEAEVDWVLKVNGIALDKWAIWGAVDVDLQTGLVAQYRLNTQSFETNNQTIVKDTLGLNNGTLVGKTFNDGTVSGGVTIEEGVMKFDGVNGRVALPITNFNTAIPIDSSFTFSSWININGVEASKSYPIISMRTGGLRGRSLGIQTDATSKIRAEIRTRNDTVDGSVGTNQVGIYLNTLTEYFVAGTVDYENKIMRLYLNGNLIQSSSTVINLNGDIIDASIGGNLITAGIAGYFNGSIDDTLIFNRALSQDEITQLYNQGRGQYSSVTNGLVAQYSGRDFAGTEASPTTIYDTNHLGDGKVLESLSFDGVDNYVNGTLINSISINNPYAVSGWIKTSSTASQTFWVNTPSFNDRSACTLSSLILRCGVYNGSKYTTSKSITLSANNWYHISYVYYNSTSSDLFVNGVLNSSGTLTPSAGLFGMFNIGGKSDSTFIFNGSIDDVRIYNRSLSEAEIQTIYMNGLGTESYHTAWAVLNSPADKAVDVGNPVTLSSSAEVLGAELSEATFYYRVNGGSWTSKTGSAVSGDSDTSTLNVNFNSGDNVEWYTRWEDNEGDFGNSTTIRTFTMDNTAPSLTINDPIQSETYTTKTIPIDITATDTNLDKVWFSLNNQANVTYTTPTTIKGKEHSNTLTVWANDTAGNIVSSTLTFNVNTFNITLNAPDNNSIQYTTLVTTNSSANVTGGAYLTNASLNLSVNGGAWEIRNTSILGGTSNYVSENTPGTWTEDTFSSSQDGIKILTKNNVLVYNVTKRSYSGATSARILDASKNVIATASFSGNIATFSTPVELSNNTNYFIATWNNGNNYNIAYTSATSYSGTYYNFVEGLRDNGHNIKMIEIVSVGMASYNFSTTLTVLFTNAFNAGDVVDFNYEFCDTDGDCGQSETRRFTIDSTAPTIEANLTDDILYAWEDNMTVNYNITDVNLDFCYYIYAGKTPSYINCTGESFNFTTEENYTSITLHAVDQANNRESKTLNFSLDSTAPTINITSPTGTINYLYENYTLDLNWTVEDIGDNLDSCWYEYPPRFYETTTYGFSQGLRIQIDNINFSNFETLSYYYNGSIGHNNKGFTLYDNGTFDNEITLEGTPNGTGIVEINLSNSYGVGYGDTYSTLTGRNLTSEGYVEIDSTNPHDIGTKKLIGGVGSSPRYFFEELTGSTANWSEAQSNADCDFSSLNIRPTIELNTNIGNYVCVKTENRGNYRIEIISEDSWDVRKLNVISGLKRLVYSTRSVCLGGNCGWGGYEKIYGINLFANSLDCNLNTTTFNYIPNINNLTFYANDTIGNLKAEVFGWDYKVFENSISYSSQVIEGEPTQINGSFTLSQVPTSIKLIYDGAEFTPSLTSSGLTYNATSSVYAPQVTGNKNISFYYEIVVGGETIVTDLYEHLVLDVSVSTNCSGGTFPLLTFLNFDEDTRLSLNGTVEYSLSLLNNNVKVASTNGTTNGFNVSLCANLNLSQSFARYELGLRYYKANEYFYETYNIKDSAVSNLPLSINLYFLNMSKGVQFKINYKDFNYLTHPGALIQIQRQYLDEDLYRLVELPKISDEGQAIGAFSIDNIRYKLIVIEDGKILDTFENIFPVCQNIVLGTCELNLRGDEEVDVIEEEDFIYSISQSNNSITLTYVIPSGTPKSVSFSTTQDSRFINNLSSCTQTQFGSGATLTCDYNNTVGDSNIEVSVNINGVTQLRGNLKQQENLQPFFLTNNYFIAFILLLTLALIFISSGVMMVLSGVVGLFYLGFIYLINSSSLNITTIASSVMWLIIAVGLILYKIAQKEERT